MNFKILFGLWFLPVTICDNWLSNKKNQHRWASIIHNESAFMEIFLFLYMD